MITRCKLTKKDDIAIVNETLSKSMIGKLQYVVHNIPNIAHVVGIVARLSSNPKETHMIAVKRIFTYQKGTKDYGLWYKKEGDFELRFYMDANWARNVNDGKRKSGGEFFQEKY